MIKKILLPIAFFFVSIAVIGQTIGTGTRSDCVGGFNVYYFSGSGTVISWAITGASYTNLVYGSNNSSISFNWSGASGTTTISATYTGGSCPSTCNTITPAFSVSPMVTPSVTISPAAVSTSFGTSVTLTANPTNGGTTPVYTWYLNGVAQPGSTNKYISATLQHADQVYVTLQSSATCKTSYMVNSTNTVIPTITYPLTVPVVTAPPPVTYNTSTTLTASGADPMTEEVYRWYALKSGGSPLNAGWIYNTPIFLDHKTFYVSKYNPATNKESGRVPQVVTVVVPPPTAPVVSTNTCGGKTLTMGTPPAGTAWYWQGTNSAGTSTNSAPTYSITESSSQTYYIRAKASPANIWSTPVGVEITTDPVDLVVNSYQPQNTIIQATNSITLKPGFTVSTGNQLNARIAITWECNDIYNWSEQIVYDQNEQPLSRSRTYTSALGQELQSQSIDYASNKIWVTQPIYDKNNTASASTLPAPIAEQDFIFKKKFVTNAAAQPYSDSDFNLPVSTNAAGEIKNPKPVDNTKANTLGWYYSTNNTLEPNTPTTSFPYARTYTPEGPDPTIATVAGPGDQYRMGSNHEVVGERQKFLKSELVHYFALRPFFVNSPLPVSQNGTNLLSNADATSLTGFTGTLTVSLTAITIANETYVKAVNNQMMGAQGVFPIGGAISVTAGSMYTFKVKGYRSSAIPVALVVQNATNSTMIPVLVAILPGSAGSEGFVETTFIVPVGCTSIKLGIQWTAAPAFIGDSFFINSVSLTQLNNPETMTYGYRSVSTDPDGKKTISFSDADGHELASALILTTNNSTTPPTYTYDYWSYTYYNDMGQVVATVAPNGVVIGNNSSPKFVTTYKYDHLGRLIETTSADEGTSQFVYSLDGKIRFSQNAEQRRVDPITKPFQNFSYTNYDYLGRLIESGEYTSNGTNPFVFEPHSTTTPATYSVLQNSTLEAIGFSGISRTLDATRCQDYSYIQYDTPAEIFLANQAPSPNCDNLSGYTAYSASPAQISLATINGETYIKTTCIQAGTGSGPGIYATTTVAAGEKYRFIVSGYATVASPSLFLEYNGTTYAYGSSLPISAGIDNSVSFEFTIPAGITSMRYGLRWMVTRNGSEAFYLNSISLQKAGLETLQTNLFGQVSKTENANAKTWYSYDEFGQLTWSKQDIFGFDVKGIDYTYDYFGNVTQVAYQQSKPDKFYHHYVYDIDQRLSEAYTSLDGSSKTLRAKYSYYLHGPLKRVELMNGSIPIQGLDYVYTITGSLKTINNAEIERDPGGDGISGTNAGFPKDIFGSTLHYHDNDFAAYYNAGPQTISGYTNQYGGLLKAQSWHNATDNNQGTYTYAYAYDNVSQLNDAKFGNVLIGTGTPSIFQPGIDKFREAVTSYDKNGNILALTRNGKIANVMANYAYVYEANTNKLDKVNHQGSLLTDFGYNTIGQMTTQVEGAKTMKVAYNPYGLVKEVKNASDQLTAAYVYDDQGNRVQQSSYNAGTLIKTTYYVHDASGNVLATYEKPNDAALKLIEVPIYGAGRIGLYKPALTTPTVFYEVSDHLGNVRGVIGNPATLPHTATMEDNGLTVITNPRVQELALFQNITATDVQHSFMNHSPATTDVPVPKHSSYLSWVSGMSGQDAAQKSVGPAIGIKVEAGDKLDITVWDKYKKKSAYSRQGITGAISSILGSSFVGTAPGLDILSNATSVFQNGMNAATALTFPGNGSDVATVLPAAGVYYLLYDRNFVFITSGWKRVTSNGGFENGDESISIHEQLAIPQITITEPGYIYIFVSNESENTEVWFDDLNIQHQRSNIVAGADYYPFGLAMDGREITREDYRYGYQGQYSEKDKTTGWNEFELRMYDARFGRWISTDPAGQFASPYVGMGNNPVNGVDPDGAFWGMGAVASGAVIGAGVGLVAGTAYGLLTDKKNWGWYALGGAAGFAGLGALGGAIYDASTYNLTGIGRTGKGGANVRKGNLARTSGGGGGTFKVPGSNFKPPVLVSPASLIPLAQETQTFATVVSPQGVRFIAQWEGFSSRLYNDAANHATIGFGTLVHMGPVDGSESSELRDGITRQEGQDLMYDDAVDASQSVNELINVPLNPCQHDALTSLVYNIGARNFRNSTLRTLINSGNATRAQIRDGFMRFNKAKVGGVLQVLSGLTNRRAAEAKMFSRRRC